MSQIPFASLPDHARLWIFGADRPLAPGERSRLESAVERGLAGWAAHGSPVTWGHTLMHDQFLLIGVDESRTALSGCSIDSAVHEIQALEGQLGLSLLDHGRVFYRTGEAIRVVPRAAFRKLVEGGEVDSGTIVFNNVLPSVGELRQGLWEVPAQRSWHAQAFPQLAG